MMTRRFVFATLFVWTFAVLGAPAIAATSSAEDAAAPSQAKGLVYSSAQSFIESLADQAVQALTAEGVSREDRQTRFRTLLNSNFDVNLIGKWVLGRYWRAASAAEKSEYLKLFEDYIVVTYVERFDQYKGERLNVMKSAAEAGKDALVYSEINRPSGGDPIRVDWRVRSHADVYRIIDVYVEGISMSQTQRKEFASVIRSNGGKVSGLIDVLRTKVADLSK